MFSQCEIIKDYYYYALLIMTLCNNNIYLGIIKHELNIINGKHALITYGYFYKFL